MPQILAEAEIGRQNVIIRPRGPVIQLNDLDTAAVERLRPVSFLATRTSPGKHQAWVAIADADEEFARQLRKGTRADLAASSATRVSGSINFKEKYAPTFPLVETVHADLGRTVRRVELHALDIVAPPERTTPKVEISYQRSVPRGWPSYDRCIAGAPEAREGGRPDISRADFTFCLLAIDWGWSVEETAARLMEVSSKARENGVAYAGRTAERAATAIERRGRVGP